METKIKTLSYGMIGGGIGSGIGEVHRIAARLDGLIELKCGAFSSTYEKTLELGTKLNLANERIYKDYKDMLEAESKREDKVDFIAIVTPNNLHYEQTVLALNYGFHVLLDKPLCLNTEEAYSLEKLIKEKNLLFCLTHTYTGYPMIKEARHIVTSGKLGKLRKVCVDYPQGWLTTSLESQGHKQAEWRTDPKRAGSCCLGDIGTHAFNLLEYVTDLKTVELVSDISTFVESRQLEDDVSILLRLEGGVKGTLQASQILTGEENYITVRVWGDKGGLEWNQGVQNSLTLKWNDKPTEILRCGTNFSYLSDHARLHARVPGGHPEGYLEAFANIYRNFAYAIMGIENDVYDYPGIKDGVRGMLFVEKVILSAKENKWVEFS
jgi:predicted dehydrogenase